MRRFLHVLALLLFCFQISGVMTLSLETECEQTCGDEESDPPPSCQDCACCFNLRVFALPGTWVTRPAQPNHPVASFLSNPTSNPHPREISHVPKLTLV